ncbi:MAG: hypothetical protein M3300_00895, partial [Actinomycetota bacterium]|nr:hypothetical protein [Actinomycetota bacterium]
SSNPSFGDHVRLRCAYRGAQDGHALAGEHGIEHAGEFAVAVPDQEPELGCAVAEVHQRVAFLLGHPGVAGVRGNSEKMMDATGGVLHNEQHVQPLEQQCVDAEEIGGENTVGLPA